MGQDSKIQWAHHTWNPWRGCTKVSPGCANCYAETLAKRNPAVLGVWGDNGTRVVASESQWREPLKWDKAAKAAGERHRVFCASLADVFETWDGPVVTSKGEVLGTWGGAYPWTPRGDSQPPANGWRQATLTDVRSRLFNLIANTPNLDWLLLTKRPQNAIGMIHHNWPNVWVGTTVENQEQADKRIPILLKIPAAVRFLSVEPMFGPIDLNESGGLGVETHAFPWELQHGDDDGSRWVPGVDWVICGGESGAKARPFVLDWARSVRDQCQESGVPFFMKQLGANPHESHQPAPADDWAAKRLKEEFAIRMDLRDSHGGGWDEWPSDLRIREFPSLAATTN